MWIMTGNATETRSRTTIEIRKMMKMKNLKMNAATEGGITTVNGTASVSANPLGETASTSALVTVSASDNVRTTAITLAVPGVIMTTTMMIVTVLRTMMMTMGGPLFLRRGVVGAGVNYFVY